MVSAPSADVVLLEAALSASEAEARRLRAGLEAAEAERSASLGERAVDLARRRAVEADCEAARLLLRAKDVELRRLGARVEALEAALHNTVAASGTALQRRDEKLRRSTRADATAAAAALAELDWLRAERGAAVSAAADAARRAGDAARREGEARRGRTKCVELYLRARTLHARFKATVRKAAAALAQFTAAPLPSRQCYLDAKRDITSLQTSTAADDRNTSLLEALYAQHLGEAATTEPRDVPQSPRRLQPAGTATPRRAVGPRIRQTASGRWESSARQLQPQRPKSAAPSAPPPRAPADAPKSPPFREFSSPVSVADDTGPFVPISARSMPKKIDLNIPRVVAL
ncbi:hypothetical protein M885DRAFT_577914 [Pelagophyceae sp. CCMP2097]|nr:hypothetical protein M885DRAFT_577914 [Pelagophyceae sp. CCMP2097]